MKRYDREYYRRWYRDPETRITTTESLRRKVRLAVSTAEFLLQRPIRSVLDVGCGEAPWRVQLKRLRHGVRYLGVESSEYVVAKLGARRSIRRGDLGSLASLGFKRPFDLVVCADVIQYVPDAELRRGLGELRRLTGGVAYIEAFAREDSMEGDREGWIDRSETALRRLFSDAGFTQCGPYCWIDHRKIRNANRLELA
jgi:SAM-dependent methyltransferase